MRNIKQLTNFDVKNNSTVIHDGKTYRIIPTSQLGITPELIIDKLGYCVNNNTGINYPIYIEINGDGTGSNMTKFEIGKTGMFEYQTDEWKDINDDDEIRDIKVYIGQIHVPDEIPFVLDYSFKV